MDKMSDKPVFMKAFEGKYSKKHNVSQECHYGKCLFPPWFSDVAQDVLNFACREDDVWLVSFPRTGSTWCQEMVWLIQNNLDFKTAQSTLQQLRAPLIESYAVLFEYVDTGNCETCQSPLPRYQKMNLPLDLLPNELQNVKTKLGRLFSDSVSFVDELASPRCIKSHLSYECLPEKIEQLKPKIIYTMRNPKDLCVSYYFHCQMVHKINVDLETFCEFFLNDATPVGSVFNHYFGFWNRRHEPNILILRYEDMKADTPGAVKKIAKFLEKPLTDEDVDAICEFLSFQNMRDNKACNLQILVDNTQGSDFYKKSGRHFIRKGIVGDYKNHMPPEMIEKFDKWIEKNTKGTDLKF